MHHQPRSTEEAVEQFLDLVRRGERVESHEFIARNAHLGADLREAIEALVALESAASAVPPEDFDVPERVGRYRIVREIGRGGMGVVLEAIEDPLGRRVALKLMPPMLLASSAARARFQREAELAARLDHPSIATVYGTGVEGSRPWIAMRFVDGITLARAIVDARESGAPCARIAPSIEDPGQCVRAVVTCIAKVARALQAAHEQGVVHRDVKPSNVLITSEGEPVLVDFGLAIAAEPDAAELTRTGETPGTPAYIAPEIVGGQRARHDVQGDVYALGVTLYECLTLRRPFDGPTPVALYRAILSQTPTSARTINRFVGRDLTVVVATAMERDRSRRYASAEAFADDLERYLRNEPVLARPPSIGYRARMFVTRNRAVTAAAVVIVVMLVAGLVAALMARDRALELRARAEMAEARSSRRADELAAELDKNREMRELQASWLRVEALDVSGREVRLADVLDHAAEVLDARDGLDPRVEAELRAALASAYHALTLWTESLDQAQRARDAQERGGSLDRLRNSELERRACVAAAAGGQKAGALERARALHAEAALRASGDDLDEALWRVTLGEMSIHNSLYADAEADLRTAIATLGRIGPADRSELLDARMLFVRTLRRQGRIADTEAEAIALVADCERLLGPDHFTTMLALSELSGVRLLQRRFEDALPIKERILASFESRFGSESEATLGVVSDLAGIVRELGALQRGEELARRAAEGTRALRGLAHPLTESRWGRWGNALIAVGRLDDGLAKLEEALETRSARLGSEDPDTLEVQTALGNALYRAGRFERCHEVLRAAFDAYLRRLGPDHAATLTCQNSLGLSLIALGRHEEAADILRNLLEVRSANLGRLDPHLLVTMANLARASAQAGRSAEAIALLDDLLERKLESFGPAHPETWTLAEAHGDALILLGRVPEANDLAARALSAARAHPRTTPERLCELLNLRSRTALAASELDIARSSSQEALAVATERLAESSSTRAAAEHVRGTFLVRHGDVQQGIELLESALARSGGELRAPRRLVAELIEACEENGMLERASDLRAARPPEGRGVR